jgi:hypothetical protein
MKLNDIYIGRKISEHLYYYNQEINPKDLLIVIRFLAEKGCDLGSLNENKQIFYITTEVSKEEFAYVYDHCNKDSMWLENHFTRENLVNRVGQAIKIVSSTTKTEIIQKIVNDKGLLFKFFKKDFLERYCAKWTEFKRNKIFLPSIENAKNLAFVIGSRYRPLSGKNYLQYWGLGDDYIDKEPDRNFKTQMTGNNLLINLKDDDEVIIKNIERLLQLRGDKEYELRCLTKDIKNKDLDIEDAKPIDYSFGMKSLFEHFRIRKNSKFNTFCEGLKGKKDNETVKRFLEKRFLISQENHDIYCGISYDKDIFEKLAWHLRIEYLGQKKIVCRVVEQETPETIAALWQILHDGRYIYRFVFVEL